MLSWVVLSSVALSSVALRHSTRFPTQWFQWNQRLQMFWLCAKHFRKQQRTVSPINTKCWHKRCWPIDGHSKEERNWKVVKMINQNLNWISTLDSIQRRIHLTLPQSGEFDRESNHCKRRVELPELMEWLFSIWSNRKPINRRINF